MEIISKTPILEIPDIVTYSVVGLVVTILLLSMIIPSCIYGKKFGSFNHGYCEASKIWISVSLICIVFTILWTCFSTRLFGIETGRYNYKAKLDDTYTANELHDNYADITYDGEFYYFQDKK